MYQLNQPHRLADVDVADVSFTFQIGLPVRGIPAARRFTRLARRRSRAASSPASGRNWTRTSFAISCRHRETSWDPSFTRAPDGPAFWRLTCRQSQVPNPTTQHGCC